MNSIDAKGFLGEPAISVCVPMYNNGKTIARCLRSVLDQDGEFEIVIVDDDSSDDSVAIAAPMLRGGDRLIRNGSRLGAARNHNKCIELARGNYIQFVHGDDCLLPGALDKLSQCFDDPAVGLAFAPRRVSTDDLDWLRRWGTLHTRFRKLRQHNQGTSLVMQMALHGMRGNWIGEPTCVMFRRRLVLDAGDIRDDIVSLADLDFWSRLMLRSTIRFVPQELSVRYHRAFTASDSTAQPWWLDRLRILTWLIVDPASPAVIRLISGVWWLPVWLQWAMQVVIVGPDRWSQLKGLAFAPFREFRRARRLRDGMKVTRLQAGT